MDSFVLISYLIKLLSQVCSKYGIPFVTTVSMCSSNNPKCIAISEPPKTVLLDEQNRQHLSSQKCWPVDLVKPKQKSDGVYLFLPK